MLEPSPQPFTLPKGTIVPDHIAIILDGNGRWARSRNLPVTKGHEEGAKAVRRVIDAARRSGVHTITLWGFSTENWKRPPAEVRKILQLVGQVLRLEIKTAEKEKIRFVHLGRKDRLPLPLMKLIKNAEEKTKNYDKYVLNIALDYGGRDEILRAVRKIVENGVKSKKIDEELFASYLDTAGQPYPYPDLFIRTSGEQRTSGLLPWQMVYSEFYFEEDHLPDITPENLKRAILDYSCRRRRFGGKDKVTHFRFKPELTAGFEINWWRLANIPEGSTFREHAQNHLREQWGLSKELASDAAYYLAQALVHGKKEDWHKAGKNLKSFYRLIRAEVKLAFEPSIAASLELKFIKCMNGGKKRVDQTELENDTRQFISEVFRISDFQAKKAARLRALAAIERNRAEQGEGEEHWSKAQEYLTLYYKALKDRVA